MRFDYTKHEHLYKSQKKPSVFFKYFPLEDKIIQPNTTMRIIVITMRMEYTYKNLS